MIIEKDGKTWELHDKTQINIFLKQGWNIVPGQPPLEPPAAEKPKFDDMTDEEMIAYAKGIEIDTSKIKNREQLLKLLKG